MQDSIPLMRMNLLKAIRKLSIEYDLANLTSTAVLEVHTIMTPKPHFLVCLLFIVP